MSERGPLHGYVLLPCARPPGAFFASRGLSRGASMAVAAQAGLIWRRASLRCRPAPVLPLSKNCGQDQA